MIKDLVMYRNATVETKIRQYLNDKVRYEGLSNKDKCVALMKLECACKSCDLHYSGYKNIPSVLNPGSPFIFIGRNPNGREAQANKLFPNNTKQGSYFQRYLEILDIDNSQISIMNMCCCYAKGNRPPTQEEINKCVSFRHLELEAVDSNVKVFFAMGQDSFKWLYGLDAPGSLQEFGKVFCSRYKNRLVLVIPVIHPSHLSIEPKMSDEVYRYLYSIRPFVKRLKSESVDVVFNDMKEE